MTKLFLDTNIILDLLAEREGFYLPSAQLATLADEKKVILVASPISFTTVHYVLCKFESKSAALNKLRRFKIICGVCTIDDETIDKALNADFPDFEDAVQYFSALQADCTAIISRNGKDFKKASIPVMTAAEYLSSII